MEQQKTYWNNKGEYQDEIKFIDMLIPMFGEVNGYANKVNDAVEAIRVLNRFYYDIHNNGGWNLCGIDDATGHSDWYADYEKELEHLLKFVYKDISYHKLWNVTRQIKSDIIMNRIFDNDLERFVDYATIKAFRIIKNHLKTK